jgi:hypothetical protein
MKNDQMSKWTNKQIILAVSGKYKAAPAGKKDKK